MTFLKKYNHHLATAGNQNKLKFTEFSDLQSRGLVQVLARCNISLNLLLKLHDMSQWTVKILLLLLSESMTFMDVFHLGKELFLGAENAPDHESSVEIHLWKHLCDLQVVILLKPHNCNYTQHFVDFCDGFT
jgi:hypothetical protein